MILKDDKIPPPTFNDWLAIRTQRWYVEASLANPEGVRHPGVCGERFLCDRPEHRADGISRVEFLRTGTPGVALGTLIFHCEGPEATLRPGDLLYETRLAGLVSREDAS